MKPTKLVRSKGFTDSYAKKSKPNRSAIDRALRMMADNVYHPSLRTQKMKGFGDIREAHATRGQTMSLTLTGTVVYLRTCCNHDDVYRRP
jgi:hypothetical protein